MIKISKVYENGKLAVNNLALGIPPGECFGLLGINGKLPVVRQNYVVPFFYSISSLLFSRSVRQYGYILYCRPYGFSIGGAYASEAASEADLGIFLNSTFNTETDCTAPSDRPPMACSLLLLLPSTPLAVCLNLMMIRCF